MTISEHTLKAVAKAIALAYADARNDVDMAQAALQAFCDEASLNDIDQLTEEAMRGR